MSNRKLPATRAATLALTGFFVFSVTAVVPGQGPGPGGGGGGRGGGGGGGAIGQGPAPAGAPGGGRGGGGRGAQPGNGTTAVGTGAIAGSVVLEGAGTPVRRARVTLTGTELRGGRSVLSDDQGNFTFQALPAGRFTMTASKAGFVSATYGAKRAGRPGTPIQLADGQKLEKTVISMPRGSVITGIVVDENGEPSPGTQVRALRYVLQTGEKTLQAAGQDSTDDRGVYRIYALQPGDYVVSAVPVRNATTGDLSQSIASEVALLVQQARGGGAGGAGGASPADLASLASGPAAQALAARAQQLQQQLAVTEQVQQTTYAPIYYPGTASPASAATVTLGISEERAGVDFRLQLVGTAKISGVIVGQDGTVPQNTQVALVPAERGAFASAPGMGSNMTRINPQGQFTFQDVTPGQYLLQARANVLRAADGTTTTTDPAGGRGRGGFAGAAPGGRGGPGGAGAQIVQVLWASSDLTVTGQDIANLNLVLQPGMTVSGRVEFAAGAAQPPTDLTRVRVNLTTRGQQTFEIGAIPPGQVDASGHFTISGVAPGRYVMTANIAPAAPAAAGAAGQAGVAGAGAPARGAGGGAGGAGGGRGGAGTNQWILKSAVVNGRDALDFPVEIAPNQEISGATLTFTDRTQDLTGTIQDSMGRPTADFTIIVFPTDNRYWMPQARRIASARPGTDGRFSFRGLPAGEYRITAVTDVEPGEWYDPAFLAQLTPASLLVSLNEGQSRVQDIKVASN